MRDATGHLKALFFLLIGLAVLVLAGPARAEGDGKPDATDLAKKIHNPKGLDPAGRGAVRSGDQAWQAANQSPARRLRQRAAPAIRIDLANSLAIDLHLLNGRDEQS